MKIFPETEAYAVSYIPGTCGSFLCMLIAEFTKTLNQVQFSKNGNAHITRVGSNQTVAQDFDVSMLREGELFSRFLETDPLDPSLPITLTEHYEIDYDRYFQKYPKGKVVYIQIDPEQDRLLVEANFYFKVQVDSYHDIPFWHQLWEQESLIYFNGAKDPFDLSITEDMIKSLVTDRANKHRETTSYPFRSGDKVNMPNVFMIEFGDILKNKQKTLEYISNLTNRPITESASNLYDEYIQAQKYIWDFVGYK